MSATRRQESRLKHKRLIIASLLATSMAAMSVSCGRTAVTPVPNPQPRATSSTSLTDDAIYTLTGVTLTPRSFNSADFNAFLTESSKAGAIVSWAGDWVELSKPESGPTILAQLSQRSTEPAFIPIVELQIFTQSTGALLRPLDSANQQAYVNSGVNFVREYRPLFLGIGIEVNVLYEKAPRDFDAFMRQFNKAYDAMKQVSPDTKIFTVFQLEKMKGLGGGVFGGSNDPSKNEWSLLERLDKADFFAFTTYPGLVFKRPAEIPSDYYAEIKSNTGKPIAFTEIGWQSASISEDWQTSEADQSRFIGDFFSMSAGLDAEFDIWSFLYDQETIAPFNSMGLFRRDGTPKPGWDVWVGHSDRSAFDEN